MDNNFTGEKDGIFYKNGKPIRGFFTKSSNVTNAPDPEKIIRTIEEQTEKKKEDKYKTIIGTVTNYF